MVLNKNQGRFYAGAYYSFGIVSSYGFTGFTQLSAVGKYQ